MIQGTIPPVPAPPFDPNLIFLNDGGPPAIVMIVFLGLLATTIILWPVMRAFARRLEGKGASDPALHAEIEQLQHKTGYPAPTDPTPVIFDDVRVRGLADSLHHQGLFEDGARHPV